MRPSTRVLAGHLACAAALAVVAAWLVAPAVQGKVPADASPLFFMAPWEQARPDNLAGPVAPNLDATRYLPWYAFISQSAARGDSVLWNPNEGCGTPFLALWETRCLSPFTIPLYLLPFGQALAFSVFLKVLVAGLCAYAMASSLGTPRSLALFLGILWQLSGPLLAHPLHPLADVLPWAPLAVLAAGRISLGLPPYWPLAALALGLMLLGGDGPATAGVWLFCCGFVLFRCLLARRGLRETARGLALLAGAGGAAMALAAVQLIPFFEFLGQGTIVTPAGDSGGIGALLLSLFLPRSQPPDSRMALYAGVVSLFLLPLWFALRRFPAPIRRTRVEGLLAAAALMTLLSLAVPPLLEGLPLLNRLTQAHFLLMVPLALGYAAMEAAEEWVELDADGCRHTLKRIAIMMGVLLVILAAAVILGRPGNGEAPPLATPLLVFAGLFTATLLLVAVTLFKPSNMLIGLGLCALVLFDLLSLRQPTMAHSPSEWLFPDTAFITSLRETNARVSGTADLRQWPLGGNGLAQSFSPAGVRIDRHGAFTDRAAADPLLTRRMGSQALLLRKADIQGPFAKVRAQLAVVKVFEAGAILFRDLDARPRAWVAHAARQTDAFDPALLDAAAAPLVEDVVPPPDSPGFSAPATITSESNTRVSVQTAPNRPGYLVLADTWYPGWKATVDGKPAGAVFPVDGFSRGVVLDPGNHEIRFTYRPASVYIGLAVSLAAAIALAAGLLRLARLRLTTPAGW